MKKIFVIIILALTACVLCNAQIKVPVQTDTLVINSMQYNFDKIRPENYPFKYVIRNVHSFVFGDQEFIIERAYSSGFNKYFELKGCDERITINDQVKSQIIIEFAGYILVCQPLELKQ